MALTHRDQSYVIEHDQCGRPVYWAFFEGRQSELKAVKSAIRDYAKAEGDFTAGFVDRATTSGPFCNCFIRERAS